MTAATTRVSTAISACRTRVFSLGSAEFEYITNSTYICKISLYFALLI
jgi:hypothetical protein